MRKGTFKCSHMGITMSITGCLKNYEGANPPGMAPRGNEDDPCFSCPQGQERKSAQQRTEERIEPIFNPQPSRKLCAEDYTRVVEDLKRNYKAGEILIVPDFVKKSGTFARLNLAAREEFWFKAISQKLVDYLKYNEYRVTLEGITLPNLDDLLADKKTTNFSSVLVSVTTTLPPERTPHVVRILPPEVKPETKAQTRAKEKAEKEAKKEAKAGEKAEKEAKKKTTKQIKDAARRKKKKYEAALNHFGGKYQRLPTEAKMTQYRPFLMFLFHEEGNGRILYNRYSDVIEASGCHTRRVEFGGTCYDNWLADIQRYSFVKMGETLENILLNGRIRHARRISPNLEAFNEMCEWLSLNRLKIQPDTPPPNAP